MAGFKERLDEALKKAGLNRNELAKLAGINRAMFTQWCQGKAKIKIENARKLAEILNCDPDWLRGDEKDEIEIKMITRFRNLNFIGKMKAFEYVEDLAMNPKYINTESEDSEVKKLA